MRRRFDLGLELDSAEVRGVLLNDDGEECGRASKSPTWVLAVEAHS